MRDFDAFMRKVHKRHKLIFHAKRRRIREKNKKLFMECRLELVKYWFNEVGGKELDAE